MSSLSLRGRARLSGVFYLFTIITGVSALYVAGALVVPGDAAATAANIRAHPAAFWYGFAADIAGTAAYVAVTAAFYDLFAPVHRGVSRYAAYFSLVGCAIGAFSGVFQLAAFGMLRSDAFPPAQREELALFLFRLKPQGIGIGLVFFGVYCSLIGWLVLRSGFLPRAIGGLMMFAGLGWLAFLVPPLAQSIGRWVMLPGTLGEGALMIWLLTKGAAESPAEERAFSARAGAVAAPAGRS